MTNLPKDSLISSAEALDLINMEKYFINKCDKIKILLPSGVSRDKKLYLLSSKTGNEKFLINYSPRNISIYNGSTMLLRSERYKTIPLFRVDLAKDKPHKNLDGRVIKGYHVHIYDENFGDRIAYPLTEIFSDLDDNTPVNGIFKRFLEYCHVKDDPSIELLVV